METIVPLDVAVHLVPFLLKLKQSVDLCYQMVEPLKELSTLSKSDKSSENCLSHFLGTSFKLLESLISDIEINTCKLVNNSAEGLYASHFKIFSKAVPLLKGSLFFLSTGLDSDADLTLYLSNFLVIFESSACILTEELNWFLKSMDCRIIYTKHHLYKDVILARQSLKNAIRKEPKSANPHSHCDVSKAPQSFEDVAKEEQKVKTFQNKGETEQHCKDRTVENTWLDLSDNLLKDWYCSQSKYLNDSQKKHLLDLTADIKYKVNCFELMKPVQGTSPVSLKFICKVCNRSDITDLKEHSEKQEHLKILNVASITSTATCSSGKWAIPKLDAVDVQFFDFNSKNQEYLCSLCNIAFSSPDVCVQHFESLAHSQKLWQNNILNPYQQISPETSTQNRFQLNSSDRQQIVPAKEHFKEAKYNELSRHYESELNAQKFRESTILNPSEQYFSSETTPDENVLSSSDIPQSFPAAENFNTLQEQEVNRHFEIAAQMQMLLENQLFNSDSAQNFLDESILNEFPLNSLENLPSLPIENTSKALPELDINMHFDMSAHLPTLSESELPNRMSEEDFSEKSYSCEFFPKSVKTLQNLSIEKDSCSIHRQKDNSCFENASFSLNLPPRESLNLLSEPVIPRKLSPNEFALNYLQGPQSSSFEENIEGTDELEVNVLNSSQRLQNPSFEEDVEETHVQKLEVETLNEMLNCSQIVPQNNSSSSIPVQNFSAQSTSCKVQSNSLEKQQHPKEENFKALQEQEYNKFFEVATHLQMLSGNETTNSASLQLVSEKSTPSDFDLTASKSLPYFPIEDHSEEPLKEENMQIAAYYMQMLSESESLNPLSEKYLAWKLASSQFQVKPLQSLPVENNLENFHRQKNDRDFQSAAGLDNLPVSVQDSDRTFSSIKSHLHHSEKSQNQFLEKNFKKLHEHEDFRCNKNVTTLQVKIENEISNTRSRQDFVGTQFSSKSHLSSSDRLQCSTSTKDSKNLDASESNRLFRHFVRSTLNSARKRCFYEDGTNSQSPSDSLQRRQSLPSETQKSDEQEGNRYFESAAYSEVLLNNEILSSASKEFSGETSLSELSHSERLPKFPVQADFVKLREHEDITHFKSASNSQTPSEKNILDLTSEKESSKRLMPDKNDLKSSGNLQNCYLGEDSKKIFRREFNRFLYELTFDSDLKDLFEQNREHIIPGKSSLCCTACFVLIPIFDFEMLSQHFTGSRHAHYTSLCKKSLFLILNEQLKDTSSKEICRCILCQIDIRKDESEGGLGNLIAHYRTQNHFYVFNRYFNIFNCKEPNAREPRPNIDPFLATLENNVFSVIKLPPRRKANVIKDRKYLIVENNRVFCCPCLSFLHVKRQKPKIIKKHFMHVKHSIAVAAFKNSKFFSLNKNFIEFNSRVGIGNCQLCNTSVNLIDDCDEFENLWAHFRSKDHFDIFIKHFNL